MVQHADDILRIESVPRFFAVRDTERPSRMTISCSAPAIMIKPEVSRREGDGVPFDLKRALRGSRW
jgi:hypothetical protein